MISPELFDAVMEDIILLQLVGIRVVLVHGGGPEINEMLAKIGKTPKFLNGLRYTDKETMEIVQGVLCGKVNKDLVATIIRKGGRAVGLCGIDESLIEARQMRRMTARITALWGYRSNQPRRCVKSDQRRRQSRGGYRCPRHRRGNLIQYQRRHGGVKAGCGPGRRKAHHPHRYRGVLRDQRTTGRSSTRSSGRRSPPCGAAALSPAV